MTHADATANERESGIELLSREATLDLAVNGGLVVLEHARVDNTAPSRLELKCRWYGSLFSLHVNIGDERHHPLRFDEAGDLIDAEAEAEEVGWSLGQCPIMLTVYCTDEKWLGESAEREGGEALVGRLRYWPRDDGIGPRETDRRPTITAWTTMGGENYRLLRERLLLGGEREFSICLTVRFPPGSVEMNDFGRSIQWDGEGELAVTRSTAVWKRNDWSADFNEDRFRERPGRRAEPKPVPPPREHSELLGATQRIEAAVSRLATPLWIAVGVAAAYVIFR